MLKKAILKSALGLFLFSISIFLAVTFIFGGKGLVNWDEFQYILATSISNAFIITTVYALVAAYNLLKYGNLNLSKNPLSFIQTFALTFAPGTIAGLMALISIFLFFTYIEPQKIHQLLQEYLDYSLYQAKLNGSLEEVEPIINSPAVRNTNVLSIQTFTLISLAIIFFNFSLGLMFSFLWKVKNTK